MVWYYYCIVLYLIEILHQTTTRHTVLALTQCCILLKFYIKPQRMVLLLSVLLCCILLKFYIKPQRRVCYLLIMRYLRAFVCPKIQIEPPVKSV